jgi:hypothetical protein
MPQVNWRKRLRCGSTWGWSWLAIAPSGRSKSGVEMWVSIRLFGFTSPSPKLKNVCQPMKRRAARECRGRRLTSPPHPHLLLHA